MATFIATTFLLYTLTGVNSAERNPSRRVRSPASEPVDGGFSDWILYSLCDTSSCTEMFTRHCNNPRPQHGGATCTGASFKKERCREDSQCVTEEEEEEESVDQKRTWSKWGSCSVTCGTGVMSRTLLPCNKGKNCKQQQKMCFKPACTGTDEGATEEHGEQTHNDGFAEWSEWSECMGCIQTRTRRCEEPVRCGSKTETETQRCTDCFVDTETMTHCQRALHDQTNFGRGRYRVTCTEEGQFGPRQCDSDRCWCVHGDNGRVIIGTRHPANESYECEQLSEMSVCRALRTVAQKTNAEYVPRCQQDGSFAHRQELGLVQWCVYRDGYEIENTRRSLNEDLSCPQDLARLTKCQALSNGTLCSAEGDFLSTQCTAGTAETENCHCVFGDGYHKEGTESNCNIHADITLPKCLAMSQLNPDAVSCLPWGEYASEHCYQKGRQCFCVTRNGTLIHDSGSPMDGVRRTTCEEVIEMREQTSTTTNPFSFRPISTYRFATSQSPPITTEQIFLTTEDYLTASTSEQPIDPITSAEYGEWSDWGSCDVECGGGVEIATRMCAEPGGCDGPDIAHKYRDCNKMPCEPASIDSFAAVWSEDKTSVKLVCTASGLPRPTLAIRDQDGFFLDVETEPMGATALKVSISMTPTETADYVCVATGEGQDRETLTLDVEPAVVDEFVSSELVVYILQQVILRCTVAGLPLPGVKIYTMEEGLVAEGLGPELSIPVLPTEVSSTYYCSPTLDGVMTGEARSITVTTVDPCEGVTCQPHATCVVVSGGVSECQCKECPGDDLDGWDPVCGSDCETYVSECALEKAMCESGANVTIIHEGSCSSAGEAELVATCPAEYQIEGSAVVLECSLTGLTVSDTITWSKGGVVVGSGPRLAIPSLTLQDSGEYTCSASGCSGDASASCSMVVERLKTEECTQYGAGHFRQFSGATFNYPGVCHYILAMDCRRGSFYIYTGTSECGTPEIPLAYASSVVVYVGRDAVQLLRGFDVNEFGVTRHLRHRDELIYQNFRISRHHDLLSLTHPSTNFTLHWDGITTVSLTMDKGYAGKLCGLCGDVGMERNHVEDPREHGARFEVDRHDRCNVADVPQNTCTSEAAERNATDQCTAALYNPAFSRCHDIVSVDRFMESCVFDTCGVAWRREFHTGLCNVLQAYSIACTDLGVDVNGWRYGTPCSQEVMHRVAFMSKRRRRRKRSLGLSELDIMFGGD